MRVLDSATLTRAVKRMRSASHCEVAVIGAGPYGLAVAAHLRAAGVQTRIFGRAMSFWREHMPRGMYLRHSSNIADPLGRFTLNAYSQLQSDAPGPLRPLQNFIGYGEWFQQNAVGDLDTRKVVLIQGQPEGFRLMLEDGETVEAGRVVIALGLSKQAYKPEQFAGFEGALVTHTFEHADLSVFRGWRVAVVGRGQSACESAVLLAEAGADAELVCRGPVHWIGSETPGHTNQSFMERVCDRLQPISRVGPFPLNWIVDGPGLMHRMPPWLRDAIAAHSLRPAATAWLKPRANSVRILAGPRIVRARKASREIALDFDDGKSHGFDHVLLATGYRIDIGRLGIFETDLLGRIECSAGFPVLSAGCESSVPGLHFVGASAVKSFGPLMRFVSGTGYAARSVARAVRTNRQ